MEEFTFSSETSTQVDKYMDMQNAETEQKDPPPQIKVETIPSSFKTSTGYADKKKNFHQRQSNYFDNRHNNHHSNYTINYSNINTMNKGHRTNSVTYYPGQRYGNQNLNKNINNNDSRKGNFGGAGNYLGKKKKMSASENNQAIEFNNSSKNNNPINMNKNNKNLLSNLSSPNNSTNFVHPYPESQDYEHYQQFKNLNLKFLRQNYRLKLDQLNEEDQDIFINGLTINNNFGNINNLSGLNNLSGVSNNLNNLSNLSNIGNLNQNINNTNSTSTNISNLMKLNFNNGTHGWNFPTFTNQLNMLYMMNLINSQGNLNNNINQNIGGVNNLKNNNNQAGIMSLNNSTNNNTTNQNNNNNNNNKIVSPVLLNSLNMNQSMNNLTNAINMANMNGLNNINNLGGTMNSMNIANLVYNQMNNLNNNKFKNILLHQSQPQQQQQQQNQQNQIPAQQNSQNNQMSTSKEKNNNLTQNTVINSNIINNQVNKFLDSNNSNNPPSASSNSITNSNSNSQVNSNTNSVNNHFTSNNNTNFNNAFNALVKEYLITLQTQKDIVNKMIQLFNSNFQGNNIPQNYQEMIPNLNQLKTKITNEMSQLASSASQTSNQAPTQSQNQNQTIASSNNNINNSSNNSTNNNSKLNNSQINSTIINTNNTNTSQVNNQNNTSINTNTNSTTNVNTITTSPSLQQNGLNLATNNEQNIQNILSVWPQEKFIKPYAPLLKLSKPTTSSFLFKKTSNLSNTSNNQNLSYNLFNHGFNTNLSNNLNINTMTFNNMNMNGINQNILFNQEQDFNNRMENNVPDDRQIEEYLKTGQCLSGVIRMNKTLNHGYITIPGLDNDILIKGTKNLFSCLNLDEVVVELFPINQWKPLVNKKTRKFSHVNEEELFNRINQKLLSNNSDTNNNKNNKEEGNDEKENKEGNNSNTNNNNKKEEEEEGNITRDNFSSKEERLKYINSVYDLRPEGRIIKILKSPNKEKEQICKIQIEKKYIFAIPIDETIPKIFINERNPNLNQSGSSPNLNSNNINNLNTPNIKLNSHKNHYNKEEFERDYSSYVKKYFLVKIRGHSNGNIYRGPCGYIVNEIGTCGDIDVESEVLLKQYNIGYNENFSQEIMEEIQNKIKEIQITDEYIKKTERVDFRNELVFTIDPYSSKDLDDAIHVKVIDKEKKLIEVGVHIADPTSYIEKGSILDKEAINRATSVYLVQKNIPMLPRLLSETVCSIMPKKDTLSISCIFRIYVNTGTLDDTFSPYFCLSVVRSKAKWNYELVQNIIEGKGPIYEDMNPNDWTKPENVETFNELVESVKILYEMTTLVRKQRYGSGSLLIDNNEIKFKLDPATEMPISFELEEINEAHYLIAELMLITNKLCADYLYKNIKKYSLIRRHQFLNDNKFNEIQRYFSINKINSLDFEDPQELNKLLTEMGKNSINKYLCIQHKLKTFMLRAEYVLACQHPYEELRHSALNFDLYTHFTAPIRRYPDIIVHRQLKAILAQNKNGELNFNCNNDNNNYDEFKIYLPLMEQFNEKYANSKYISQKSRRIYQCLYLKNAPPKIYDALIMDMIIKSNNNKRSNNNNNMNLNMNLNNNFLLGMGINNITGNQGNVEEDDISMVLYVPELNLELEWKKGDNDNIIYYTFEKNKNELYIDYKIDDSGLKSKYFRTFDSIQVKLISLDSIPIDVKCVLVLN